MHFVYILESETSGTFYKGYSENPLIRLHFHNAGKSTYTSCAVPWNLVAEFFFSDKTEALRFEKKLKKYPKKSLRALIASDRNYLTDYLTQS